MAIEFDWGIFGQSIQDAARMLSGGILQKAEEKREQERWMTRSETEAAQRKLERERARAFTREMADKQKVISQELADYEQQLKQEYFDWAQEREAKSKAMLGDFDMAKQLVGAVQSGNTMGLITLRAQMGLISKLQEGATRDDFTEEELAGLQTLPPIASAGAADLLNRNTEKKQELELGAARIYQLKASGDYMKSMSKVQAGKAVDLSVLRKKIEDRAAIQGRINDIIGDPKYMEIAERMQAGDQNIEPNAVAWFSQEQEKILTHNTSLQVIDAEINTIFPGILERGRPKRKAPTEPAPKKEDTGRKIGKVIAKGTEKAMTAIIEGAREQAQVGATRKQVAAFGARIDIKRLLKKAGLPAKTKVYTNIASLRKAGKLKVGMVVFHNKKIYRVISGKGQKWDLEEL